MTTSNSAPMVSVPVELVEAARAIEERIAYYASLKADDVPNIEDWAYTDGSGDIARLRAALAAAPAPQPVQGEAAEHRMMLDDLRLYGAAFSKNWKRIPPEYVYITQPPAPAVQIAAPRCRGMASDELAAASTRAVAAGFDGCDDGMVVDAPAVQIAAPDHIADAAKYTAAALRSQLAAAPGDVEQHPLLLRAYEVVHHERECPSIGGRGDDDCRCDAVPFLRDLAATLRSQGQADAVVETEWIVSCGSGAAPAPRFDNEPAAFARWAEEVSIPSYIRSGRMRQASVTKVTTISEYRTAAALAQQANQEQPPNG